MLYLLYGEEKYLINKKLNEIKYDFEKTYDKLVMGLNYITLNNIDNIEELITEIEMPPFGYNRKLIIVRDSGLFSNRSHNLKDASEVDKFIEYLKNNKKILDSSDIIFLEDNISSSKLLNYLKKEAKVLKYASLTRRDNIAIVKILEEYIDNFNKEHNKNIRINRVDLNYIVEEVGRDLYTLLNNLNKVLFYSFDSENLNKKDIENIIIKSGEAMIYEISNNILSGNKNELIKSIDRQLGNGAEIYVVLGYIYNVFRRMYLIGLANENSFNPKSILPPNQAFLLPKFQLYIRRVGLKKIEKIMFEIMEIDKMSKFGEINAELAIKALLKQG